MNRVISVVIVMVMMITVFSVVVTDSDAIPTSYLHVDGIQVSEDMDTSEWSYVSGTHTLTIKDGANIDTSFKDDDVNQTAAPIYDGHGGTFHIVLSGNCVISGVDTTADENVGIFSVGSVVISGNGTLTISNASYSYGIMVLQHLTIESGTVTIELVDFDDSFDIYLPSTDATSGFTMSGGVLNLSSSGLMDINGRGITVTGGKIQVSPSMGDGSIVAIGGPGLDGVVDLQGGMITFANGSENQIAISGSKNTGSTDPVLIVHDLPMYNMVKDGDTLKVVGSGIAYVGSEPVIYTVTFDANGGTCDVLSMQTNDNGKLQTMPVAVRDGYQFDGWYFEPETGDKVTEKTVFENNVTVYAHWSEDSGGSGGHNKLFIGIVVVGLIFVAAYLIIKRH